MITDSEIEHFLLMSAHTWPSVVALQPQFPRWRSRLNELGIYHVPRNIHSQERADVEAVNNLTLLVRQAAMPDSRDQRVEHYLRNITRIRPDKP